MPSAASRSLIYTGESIFSGWRGVYDIFAGNAQVSDLFTGLVAQGKNSETASFFNFAFVSGQPFVWPMQVESSDGPLAVRGPTVVKRILLRVH